MADIAENGSSEDLSGGHEVEGVFKPPIFSFSGGRPMKIAGPGRCRATDDGLLVEGFKRKWPQHVKVLAGLGVILMVAILALVVPLIAAKNGESGGDSAIWILAFIAPILLIVLPLIRGYDEHNPDKPLSHTIRWDHVRSVRRGRVTVAIDVVGGRPKGLITFEPKGDPQALVAAIKGRLRKPQ